jgi:hypothetical protein
MIACSLFSFAAAKEAFVLSAASWPELCRNKWIAGYTEKALPPFCEHTFYQGGMLMELWITLCFMGVLGVFAGFFVYFISSGLDLDDSHTIDPSPSENMKKKS